MISTSAILNCGCHVFIHRYIGAPLYVVIKLLGRLRLRLGGGGVGIEKHNLRARPTSDQVPFLIRDVLITLGPQALSPVFIFPSIVNTNMRKP